MSRRWILPLLLVAAACSSSSSQEKVPGRPAVGVQQLTPIFFGSGYTAPVSLEIGVQNIHAQPIRIHRIRIEPGAGMGQFSIYPVERILNEDLGPGGVKTLAIVATAYTNFSRLTPNEPFSVRAIVDYEFAGKRHRGMYIFRDVSQ